MEKAHARAAEMSKASHDPFVECWTLDIMFGAVVVRGFVDGRPRCQLLRWSMWAIGRVGVSSGSPGTEEVWRYGAPSHDPYLWPRKVRERDGLGAGGLVPGSDESAIICREPM